MILRKAAADLMTEVIETAEENSNVSEVVMRMSKRNIGAVVVLSAIKDPVGIFTERDLLKRVVGEGLDPKTTLISKVMTSKFVCAQSDDDADELAEIMIQGNFRHLPVVDGSKLVGILSLRDVVKHLSGL
ncbi:MAG: inosine-5-monophosphate dehydrogenase [Bacteriovoracaceae bacterium]|nr:inosine-5-monophosphate dehydrogenase [Bacteriovoracaceae bacterium]